jgi:chromosome segregation ATPase
MPAAPNAEAVIGETMVLRKRYNDLTNECRDAKARLAQMVERINGFIPTSALEADKDDDAAEIATLEEEVQDVESAIDVANHEHKTYELMIERIRSEEKTYKRDITDLDTYASAKQSDATKLQLMLKDATDVRDAARAELQREDEALSVELQALSQKLADKNAKLEQRRQDAAEHESRTEERLRGMERDIKKATRRREQIMSTGVESVDVERAHIAKLQGVFDSIAEAIGVSDADAIVEKFQGQEETCAQPLARPAPVPDAPALAHTTLSLPPMPRSPPTALPVPSPRPQPLPWPPPLQSVA